MIYSRPLFSSLCPRGLRLSAASRTPSPLEPSLAPPSLLLRRVVLCPRLGFRQRPPDGALTRARTQTLTLTLAERFHYILVLFCIFIETDR